MLVMVGMTVFYIPSWLRNKSLKSIMPGTALAKERLHAYLT